VFSGQSSLVAHTEQPATLHKRAPRQKLGLDKARPIALISRYFEPQETLEMGSLTNIHKTRKVLKKRNQGRARKNKLERTGSTPSKAVLFGDETKPKQ